MQFSALIQTGRDVVGSVKCKVVMTMGAGMMLLVSSASAGTLDAAVSPIITDVALLFTPILALVLAVVPILIALAVIGFVLGLISKILGYI